MRCYKSGKLDKISKTIIILITAKSFVRSGEEAAEASGAFRAPAKDAAQVADDRVQAGLVVRVDAQVGRQGGRAVALAHALAADRAKRAHGR